MEPELPALGAWSLSHWTAWEAPEPHFFNHKYSLCYKDPCVQLVSAFTFRLGAGREHRLCHFLKLLFMALLCADHCTYLLYAHRLLSSYKDCGGLALVCSLIYR